MSDAWMPSLQLKLTRAEFARLPRHPAYQYEYIGNIAYLSPWPRHHHASLDLRSFRADAEQAAPVLLRPASLDDLEALVAVFVGAFANLQPFGSLGEEQGRLAAEQCLKQTFGGGDGPLVDAASFAAIENDKIAGAILITLLPGGDGAAGESYRWQEPPPSDLWAKRQGQSHLTWIFVDRFAQRTGIGTRLLQAAASVLNREGYASLWTTFLLGNDSTLLWHWRNAFALMPHALSKRREGK